MRETCLRCEGEGKQTRPVRTPRGGVCPVHDADFLKNLEEQARAILGLPRPTLLGKGVPSRR